MSVHVTENSLRYMVGLDLLGRSRTWACDPGCKTPRPGTWVVVSSLYPLEGVASVTCPTCRVLADAALEQRDVVALMKAVAP